MNQTPDPDSQVEIEQPFMSHLIELRDRLLRAVIVVLVIFLGLFTVAGDLFELISTPLLEVLPQGSKMIATGTIDPFFTPMKLSIVMSIFVAMPFILYQGWAFIAPGLYKHEKKLLLPLMVSSTLLFYAGMAFAYYVVFPIMFQFMAGITLTGVDMMPDISRYLDIVLKLFFAFGLAFEVPIATILMVQTGMTTPESLKEKRPYVVVGAFVIGMLLTPPDIISQTLLAIPMLLLFEIGLFFSRYFLKLKKDREAVEETAGDVAEQPLDNEQDMEEALSRYERDEAALDEEMDSWEDDGEPAPKK